MQLPTAEQLAEKIIAEIKVDFESGRVPETVQGFSQLHDFVDANIYGGTEKLWDELVLNIETEETADRNRATLTDLMNAAHGIVDQWIKGRNAMKTDKEVKAELDPQIARLQWLASMVVRPRSSKTTAELLRDIEATARGLADLAASLQK